MGTGLGSSNPGLDIGYIEMPTYGVAVIWDWFEDM